MSAPNIGSNINVVIVSGILDSEVKIAETKNNNKALSFSLTVSKTVNTDEGIKTYPSWFGISSFNSAVISLAANLNKGAHVLIQGSLNVRSWMDQASGQKRIKYEINAEKMSILSDSGAHMTTDKVEINPDLHDDIFS